MQISSQHEALLKKYKNLDNEQKKLLARVKKEWQDRFFRNTRSLYDHREEAEALAGWMYAQAGLEKPQVLLASSPLHAQEIANRIYQKHAGDGQTHFFHSGHYGGARDLGWVAFYDFFARLGMLDNADFLAYRDLLSAVPLYDMIQGKKYCILTDMPVELHFDRQYRLHGERRPAIAWRDGFAAYFWHGLHTREKYIMCPESLSRKEFVAERNIEQRRIIQESLGTEGFIELLDLVETDRFSYRSRIPLLDEQALPQMSQQEINELAAGEHYEDREQEYILYRSRFRDEVIENYHYYVKVTDPSTGRAYYLSVAPQNASSAKAAVDASFEEGNLAYSAES